MDVTLSEAQDGFVDLIEHVMSGEEVVVALPDGRSVQIVARRTRPSGPVDVERRRRILDEIAASGAKNATPGPSAARSQDFLYDDETGLPA